MNKTSHTGKQPFTCNQFGRSFSQAEDAEMHLRSRTRAGKQPFTCNQSGKRFIQARNLEKHQRSHNRTIA